MTDLRAALAGFDVRERAPLAAWTTFGCAATARYLVSVRSAAELSALAGKLRAAGLAFRRDWDVLGAGSNVLVGDGGFAGVLVHLAPEGFSFIRPEAGDLTVCLGAGTPNGKFLQWTRERGRTGFEFAFGIPGTVGGGVRMNAGTPHGWFGQILRRVRTMDAAGEFHENGVTEADFAYRDFPAARDRVVVSCTVELAAAESAAIEAKVDQAKRGRATQPLERPNFGSVFRNPPGDFAGRLVEAAGLKGKTVGAARISEKHANFIVNLGGARTADAVALIEEARSAVFAKFGVGLVPEVVMLGSRE